VQYPGVAKQESHQQSTDAAVAVQEWVDGFELDMGQAGLYDGGEPVLIKGGSGGSGFDMNARTFSPPITEMAYFPVGPRFMIEPRYSAEFYNADGNLLENFTQRPQVILQAATGASGEHLGERLVHACSLFFSLRILPRASARILSLRDMP
jgi:hypothetical protein